LAKQNIIVDKSFAFALQVIETYKCLTGERHEYVISKQFLRAGTSIGANVNEAIEAQSRADFIHKMSIALKEARETHYWIKLLKESSYLRPDARIYSTCNELICILTSIIKSSKEPQ